MEDQIIKGIQAIYQSLDGKLIPGDEHIGKLEANYSCFFFDLEKFDYIKRISGSYNQEGFIDYLNVISFNGKKTKFGEQTLDSKDFEIEIGTNEIPVCIIGKISNLIGIKDKNLNYLLKSDENENVIKEGLSHIGAEITIDEVEEEIILFEKKN
jgi:hypothetical protein